MPQSALADAAPEPSRYASLFDLDAATLRGATGSRLLDAFIHDAPDEGDNALAAPSAQAILAADVEARGDIAARLLILTANGMDNLDWPARNKVMALRGLLLAAGDLKLSSCDAWELLRHDTSVIAAWRYSTTNGLFMTDFAPDILRMVANARERRLDPRCRGLFETCVAKLKHRFANKLICTASEIPSCAAMISALGQNPEDWDGLRTYRAGMAKADAFRKTWGGALHPMLTEALARSEYTPSIWSDIEDLKKRILAASADERGRIFAEVVQLPAQGLGGKLGDDHPFRMAVNLREALKNESMVFTAPQALTVVRDLKLFDWPSKIAFAKALATALPATDEARQIVKSRCDDLRDKGRWPGERRAFAKFITILNDAVRAPDSAPPGSECRRREALAAFVDAYETAIAATREAEARAEKAQAGDKIAEMMVLVQLMEGPLDVLLGGSATRQKLLRLAARVARFGSLPEDVHTKLARVERAFRLTEDKAQDLDQANWRNKQFLQRLHVEAATLAQARGLIDCLARSEPAAIAGLERLEQMAVNAPDAARPSKSWLATARATATASDNADARALLFDLMREAYFAVDFPPLGATGFAPWLGHSQAIKRAFIWLCAFWPASESVKPLAELALRAFAPSPGAGITNELLGNACLWSLSRIDDSAALSALARIGARIRYPKVRQRINALFEEAARKAGRPRAEIEEEIVPHHGFDDTGLAQFALSAEAGTAELRLHGRGKVEIVWRDGAGKAHKAPSAAMKEKCAPEIKGVRAAAQEIEADHALEAKRVEKLYRRNRTLDFARWREFYVAHPFVGPMCRRLIWRAETPEGAIAGLWRDGAFEDVFGARRDIAAARIGLWHPLDATDGEIGAWRDRLEHLRIDQPFRQAWREIYRVTDAERATGHYSNRFAGHIVRQHQFMTLARLNDWNCRHRMWQDVTNDEPTFVAFPEFGVYAEYWTAGAGGDDPPVADSTAYLYLTTDRIVFHRLNSGAAPNKPAELRGDRLGVDEVPPLAFSEIMRCCDLYVSVATIARDPHWLDRGENAQHPNQWRDQANRYWSQATTGSLEASALVRAALLARVLPALAQADRLSLDDRYLNVRGKRGDYRIHLGSGAAFRASGQHICIVPVGAPKKLILPYEGDDILALILSKAMLLIRDDKIEDPVILRQL